MNSQQLYEVWAPPGARWSPWAKPVLFLNLTTALTEPPAPISELQRMDTSWAPEPGDVAMVIDLPGEASTNLGVALAHQGYRPVPLYNCCAGPQAVLDVNPIVRALVCGGEALERINLPFDAPPVFLLDSRRDVGKGLVSPGMFDNRWITLPQDFPSANFLLSNGIRRIVLIQDRAGQPRADLAHVLLRWQDTGITVAGATLHEPPQPLIVTRPSMFRAMAYAAFALLGLRRNSAGGFGSIVPQPSSHVGYG